MKAHRSARCGIPADAVTTIGMWSVRFSRYDAPRSHDAPAEPDRWLRNASTWSRESSTVAQDGVDTILEGPLRQRYALAYRSSMFDHRRIVTGSDRAGR